MGREYKVGDEVVIIDNKDHSHGFVIGSIGIIEHIELDRKQINVSSGDPYQFTQILGLYDIAPNFKVGDLVKIKKDTRFYKAYTDEGDTSNPINEVGQITNIQEFTEYNDETLNIYVTWPSVDHNTYNYEDLELIIKYEVTEEEVPIKELLLEECTDIEVKNMVLISSAIVLTKIRSIKPQDVYHQLKISYPEYTWSNSIISHWLSTFQHLKKNTVGTYCLKTKIKLVKSDKTRKEKTYLRNSTPKLNKKKQKI